MLDEVQVALEVLALEPGMGAPGIVGLEALWRPDGAREEPTAERAVGDEADPELTDCGEDLVLGVPRPQRILALDGRDGMDGVRTTDRVRAGLGEAEVADLSLSHHLRHG